jgi:nitroreductase
LCTTVRVRGLIPVDAFDALYTTRSMRRMRADPVPDDVQLRILDAAIRAPNGGNRQDWRFVLVDDGAIVAVLAPVYRRVMNEEVWGKAYAAALEAAKTQPEQPENASLLRVMRSATYLQDHFEDIPLLLFGLRGSDVTGGSIYPAMWSAQLAARTFGVGSAIVTALPLFARAETRAALGVPDDEPREIACALAFGYPVGRWGLATRHPVHEVTFKNQWGRSLGAEVPEPLWP